MFEMDLPFDKKTLHLRLEDKNFAGVLSGRQSSYPAREDQAAVIEESLDNPIGSPRLEELAVGKKDVVIICSDHTRPIPSRLITPMLLRRITDSPAAVWYMVTASFWLSPKSAGSGMVIGILPSLVP